jgi:hypothetical protein
LLTGFQRYKIGGAKIFSTLFTPPIHHPFIKKQAFIAMLSGQLTGLPQGVV